MSGRPIERPSRCSNADGSWGRRQSPCHTLRDLHNRRLLLMVSRAPTNVLLVFVSSVSTKVFVYRPRVSLC